MNERTTILLADDDAGVAAILTRALAPADYEIVSAQTGTDALSAAARRAPDLVLLDVRMPGLSGWDVLSHLRAESSTRVTPVIMLTGCGDEQEKLEGFSLGADDYVTKPFSIAELRARIASLLKRHREAVAVNPLTSLPGSPSIQTEVERRIHAGLPFGFLYADIDRFKIYNDAYGYVRGDEAIRIASEALLHGIEGAGEEEGFIGHIGGDDFALVCSEARVESVAAHAVSAFDVIAPSLHDPADAARGWIETADRRGKTLRSPLISLSIGGATTRRRRLDCYAKAVGIASEMKSWLKRTRESGPSTWALDRRSDS